MTKVAFIKYAGMASGGVEKYMQTIACLLPKEDFQVDFYYTNVAPTEGSNFVHPDNDSARLELMRSEGIKTIEVHVGQRGTEPSFYEWRNTNFWELFNEDSYDIIQTGRGGYPEYPFNLINKTKIIDSIHSFTGEDKPNILKAILLCKWQFEKWAESGGNAEKAVVIPSLVKIEEKKYSNLREELKIPKDAFVYGFHQGNREDIFSPVSLLAYNNIKNKNNYFLIMGGAKLHRDLASAINFPNIKFVEFSSSPDRIHEFLETVDMFAHARSDGEVCSASIIEGLYHGKPVLSHPALNMGHAEQIEGCGKIVDSIEAYAQEMLCFEKNKEYLAEMSRNARKKYEEKYKYEKVVDKILGVYYDAKELLK
jgi:glycosyltransferase involved in cell wall biosynthesis